MSSASTTACENAPRRLTPRTNFWLDFLSAVVFAAMAGTGVLQRWVLRRGSNKVGLIWLGLGRHGWANVHFWLGILILALIILHLALHWSWVRACWSKFLGSIRSPLTWVIMLALLALVVLPLVVPPQTGEPGDGTGGWQEDGARTGQGVHGRGRGRLGE
jgi:hypothetical protein